MRLAPHARALRAPSAASRLPTPFLLSPVDGVTDTVFLLLTLGDGREVRGVLLDVIEQYPGDDKLYFDGVVAYLRYYQGVAFGADAVSTLYANREQ